MALFNESKFINNQMHPVFYVRKMIEDDVNEVLEIWGENDLHEGTETIKSFLKVDPDGFWVAVDDAHGEILGMCAAVFVNPNHGFIGLYGVRPKHQNKGIGFTIWKKMMSHHVGSRNAGLYAVPKHLTMYRDKAGFKHQDSKHLFIYESNFDLKTDDLVKKIHGIKIDVINKEIMSQVISYDAHVHGYLRSKLLPLTVQEKDTLSLYAFDEIELKVVGFGCFRTNNVQKAMTGPLYADNDAIAELLIYELIETFAIAKQNGLLYMTLDSNPGGITIAEKLRLEKHEELPRFFTKSVYDHAQWNRIYCIHSPNFSLC